MKLIRETFRTCDPFSYAGTTAIRDLVLDRMDEPPAINGEAIIAHAEIGGQVEFRYAHERTAAVRLADDYLTQFRTPEN